MSVRRRGRGAGEGNNWIDDYEMMKMLRNSMDLLFLSSGNAIPYPRIIVYIHFIIEFGMEKEKKIGETRNSAVL